MIRLPQTDLCGDCGRCCTTIGLPPFHAANPDLGPQPTDLTAAEPWEQLAAGADAEIFRAMPAAVRAGHAALLRSLTADPTGRPCPWYDAAARRCKQYAWRPTVCRDFAAGGDDCGTIRDNPASQLVWRPGAGPADWRNPQRPGAVRGT